MKQFLLRKELSLELVITYINTLVLFTDLTLEYYTLQNIL